MTQKILQGKNIAAIAQIFHREGMPEPMSVDLVVPGSLFYPIE